MTRPLALWLVPLLLQSDDAYAWGLITHIYFSQLLLWAVPLADARFRRAVARLPGLVLAGACLPDVSLFSRAPGAGNLGSTHQWSAARRLLSAAATDEDRALAIGYAGHLLADIVAHNHFVPTHERLWFDRPVITHAAAEWAMDAYLDDKVFARPADLMRCNRARLARYAADHFGCTGAVAQRALAWLESGERLLRTAAVHRLVHAGACASDGRLAHRFEWYVRETAGRLAQINRLIAGDEPAWDAENDSKPAEPRARLAAGLAPIAPLPLDLFVDQRCQ